MAIEAGGIRFGCTICYDIRFAEEYLALRRLGAEAIFVPSNFTLQTGKDHWEVLLKARAIESQCWILAAASTGQYEERGAQRAVYGHSLVADPWGHVVAKVSDGIGWADPPAGKAWRCAPRRGRGGAYALLGRVSRRSAMRADLPVRPRR